MSDKLKLPLLWVLQALIRNYKVEDCEGMLLVAELYDEAVKKAGPEASPGAIASRIANQAGLEYTGHLDKAVADEVRELREKTVVIEPVVRPREEKPEGLDSKGECGCNDCLSGRANHGGCGE